MPELKHTFTGGKMEKDLDERIVPNGQYREALNIGVATSEDSDVGAAQNILGNIRVSEAIRGRTQTAAGVGTEYTLIAGGPTQKFDNSHIAHIVDPQSDKLYRFINTTPKTGNHSEGIWMDRIVEYDTTKDLSVSWEDKENAVMVDIYRVKSYLDDVEIRCLGNNKTIITLHNNENLNQIRWGMKVHCGNCGPMASSAYNCTNMPLPAETTVEEVNYVNGEITLDRLWPGNGPDDWHPPGLCLYFTGDRNLNFNPGTPITGLNIIDGMLFWTDNHSEPKKIDIERCKYGSDTQNWTATPGLQGRHSSGAPKIDDFNQHTILVVEDDITYDCMENEHICTPLGCTDPSACNYDPDAVQDDGSCGGWGCMDNNALNYDSSAACPGSCCFDAGCTDPLACNYDAAVCFDDGSCVDYGCTDPTANNYDPSVSCDDGSCSYAYACIPANQYVVSSCDDPADDISFPSIGNLDPYLGVPYLNDGYFLGHTNIRVQFLATGGFNLTNVQSWDPGVVGYTGVSDIIPVNDPVGTGWNAQANWNDPTMKLVWGHDDNTGLPIASCDDGIWDDTNFDRMWGNYFYQNPTVNFADKWFYHYFYNAQGAVYNSANSAINGDCDYDVLQHNMGGPDSSAGIQHKWRMPKIMIKNMWSKVDGMDWETWDADQNKPGLVYDGGGNLMGTPGSHWWPVNAGEYYVDTLGHTFASQNDFFGYTAEFGDCGQYGTYIPCADGDNWNDVITYLRKNGFSGSGPSAIKRTSVGGDFQVGWTYHTLRPQQHGSVALGQGNPNYQYINTWRHMNVNRFMGPSGVTENYQFSTMPEIHYTDTPDVVMAKLTNLGSGWFMIAGGDMVYPPNLIMESKQSCVCSDFTTAGGCYPDNNGPYTSMGACQAAPCPPIVPPTPL